MMWQIEQNEFDDELNKSYEGMMAQGNGYISTRANLEGDMLHLQNERYWRMPANVTVEEKKHPKGKWGTYIPTIVGKHPILNEEMINLPFLWGLNLYANEEKFTYDKSTDFHRELCLKDGIMTQSFRWQKICVETKRYIHRVHKNLLVIKITLSSDDIMTCRVEGFIDADVTTNGYDHFKSISIHENKMSVLTDMNDEINIQQFMMDSSVYHTKKRLIQEKILHLSNEPIVLYKYVWVTTSKDKEHFAMPELDPKTLEDGHKKAWDKLWQASDIQITGDEKAQLSTRFSIYHMLRTMNQHDDRFAIDAKGVAGEAYYGHYFWDTEIYLLPFYILTQPTVAKNLLMFRYHTLEAAKKNAKKYGYQGAKYPWESNIHGDEQCSNWQYADNEIHVSLDICYAMIMYRNYTKDTLTFDTYFMPCIKAVLEYFKERVEVKENEVNLNGVMGPDEYLVSVNNNTYTNTLLKYVIKDYLNYIDDDMLLMIDEKLKVHKDEIILQCDDFDQYETLDFNKVWPDRKILFGAVVSQEKNYRSKALKQADVLMMMYLFKHQYTNNQIKRNMDFYLPITTHDSSLSYVIHSILLVGYDRDMAYDYYIKASSIDLYSRGAEEGIHIANCGGLIQNIIFGFCGMSHFQHTNDLSFKPQLPKPWEQVKFQVIIEGHSYEVIVNKENYSVKKLC